MAEAQEVEPVDGLSDEKRTVLYWRYKEARADGMSVLESKLFAESDIDVSELRHAVERGCPPELLASVVL